MVVEMLIVWTNTIAVFKLYIVDTAFYHSGAPYEGHPIRFNQSSEVYVMYRFKYIFQKYKVNQANQQLMMRRSNYMYEFQHTDSKTSDPMLEHQNYIWTLVFYISSTAHSMWIIFMANRF